MSNESNDQQSGFSRRDALKRGAAVGGAMWVAPLVTATPAFGAEPSDETGDLPDCVNPLWVKYGDPEPFQGGLVFPGPNPLPGDFTTGTWDDNPNSSQGANDLDCVGDYPVTDDTTNWVPTNEVNGILSSYAGENTYVETWSTLYGNKSLLFTATLTADSVSISVTSDGDDVPIAYALWFQAGVCYSLGSSGPGDSSISINGNTVTWVGEVPNGDENALDKISHLSFVICP